MATDIQNHVHLFLVAAYPVPTGANAAQWHVTFPGINPKTAPAVEIRRGLTGVAQVHALRDGSNKIVQFKDVAVRFIATPAEHVALLGLNGAKCYYVPHEHDDAGTNIKLTAAAAAQGYPVILVITEDPPLDAGMQYFLITAQLTDDSRT
jgi:hypothetical protein